MDIHQHVFGFYSDHAAEFDSSRYNHWPSVVNFINSLESNSHLIDVGCGNGKNMLIRKDLKYTGIDTCSQLIDICRKKGIADLVIADTRSLPFKDKVFDNAMSIAVIHHLPTYVDRLKACKEIIRIIRNGGLFLLEVWIDKGVNNHKFQKINNNGDYFVTWRGESKRFYHMFSEKEVNELIQDVSDVILIQKYEEANNWILLFKKIIA